MLLPCEQQHAPRRSRARRRSAELGEAALDPGYGVATRRVVSVLLTNGARITGAVRVYRPEGHDRMSDWARQPETFRYIETGDATVVVNFAHIVEVSEIAEP